MTLEQLYNRCYSKSIAYAYGKFTAPVMPPHLVAITTSTENFKADNIVWGKKTPIKLDYTYITKDLTLEATIENQILFDVAWDKTDEIYLEDEDVFQVSYYFDIIGG